MEDPDGEGELLRVEREALSVPVELLEELRWAEEKVRVHRRGTEGLRLCIGQRKNAEGSAQTLFPAPYSGPLFLHLPSPKAALSARECFSRLSKVLRLERLTHAQAAQEPPEAQEVGREDVQVRSEDERAVEGHAGGRGETLADPHAGLAPEDSPHLEWEGGV